MFSVLVGVYTSVASSNPAWSGSRTISYTGPVQRWIRHPRRFLTVLVVWTMSSLGEEIMLRSFCHFFVINCETYKQFLIEKFSTPNENTLKFAILRFICSFFVLHFHLFLLSTSYMKMYHKGFCYMR